MPYYKELNLLFIHIPKTGGTSLEEYFKNKYKQTLYSMRNDENILFEKFKIYTASLQHLTYKEVYDYKEKLDIELNENLKVITIVRNPYHRIISDLFFLELIDEHSDKEEVFKIIKKYVYENCEPYEYDNHNKPQYEFILDNNDNIISNITIFKTENLTQDVINYGFDDFDINNNTNKQNITSDKYNNYLNNDSIKLINEFYKKDFELFDYNMKII